MPRPSATVRHRLPEFAGVELRLPKNGAAPWASKAVRERRITPAVAVDSPPMSFGSDRPSSEARKATTARRSLRSYSSGPFRPA